LTPGSPETRGLALQESFLAPCLQAVLYSAIFHPMLFRGAKTIQFRGIKKVEPEPNISECGFKQTFIRNSPTADGFIIWCFEALQPEIMAHCFFFPLILFYPGKSFQFIRVWQVFRDRT
jgi:hypothetical protein